MRAAPPARADRMDDVARGQAIAFGDPGLAGGAAAQCAALLKELPPGGAVDGAVHSAAAQQRLVGRVHDGVHREPGNVRLRETSILCRSPCPPPTRQTG